MALTGIDSPPELDSFTSLADHQSQTPTTFYGAKPVLHFHSTNSLAVIPFDQESCLPLWPAKPDELVDIYVSSENFTLFSQITGKGVAIPYTLISLHAIQRLFHPLSHQEVPGLYMQIEIPDLQIVDPEDPEADIPTIFQVTLIPEEGRVQALFDAVSNCSNLHPDPTMEDDEMEEGEDNRIMFEGNVGYEGISGLPGVQSGATDGGLPPPFPGSGGWITAENVSEYFDRDGNWIGGEGEGGNAETLGEGAGRVRNHDEVDGQRTNGHDEQDEAAKRPRTQ